MKTYERYLFVLPAQAENLTTIRLATSSIASKRDISIEKLEDLKLSISEACNLALRLDCVSDFNIEFRLYEDQIQIYINEINCQTSLDDFQVSMAQMIINALVDQSEFTDGYIKLALKL